MTNPADDMQGIVRRIVPALRSYFPIPIQADGANWQIPSASVFDHFDQPTFDTAWSWAGAPFNGAPSYIDLRNRPSLLVLENDNITENHYLYRPISAGNFAVIRCAVSLDSIPSLRVSDATETNAIALRLENGTSAGTVRLRRSRTGGSPDAILADNLPQGFYNLAIRQDATVSFILYSRDTASWRELEFDVGFTFTPTRAGIEFGQRGFANSDRRAYIDWYAEAATIQG